MSNQGNTANTPENKRIGLGGVEKAKSLAAALSLVLLSACSSNLSAEAGKTVPRVIAEIKVEPSQLSRIENSALELYKQPRAKLPILKVNGKETVNDEYTLDKTQAMSKMLKALVENTQISVLVESNATFWESDVFLLPEKLFNRLVSQLKLSNPNLASKIEFNYDQRKSEILVDIFASIDPDVKSFKSSLINPGLKNPESNSTILFVLKNTEDIKDVQTRTLKIQKLLLVLNLYSRYINYSKGVDTYTSSLKRVNDMVRGLAERNGVSSNLNPDILLENLITLKPLNEEQKSYMTRIITESGFKPNAVDQIVKNSRLLVSLEFAKSKFGSFSYNAGGVEGSIIICTTRKDGSITNTILFPTSCTIHELFHSLDISNEKQIEIFDGLIDFLEVKDNAIKYPKFYKAVNALIYDNKEENDFTIFLRPRYGGLVSKSEYSSLKGKALKDALRKCGYTINYKGLSGVLIAHEAVSELATMFTLLNVTDKIPEEFRSFYEEFLYIDSIMKGAVKKQAGKDFNVVVNLIEKGRGNSRQIMT